jgi:hypothetical protein
MALVLAGGAYCDAMALARGGSRRWSALISESAGYSTTFPTPRLSAVLAIGGA